MSIVKYRTFGKGRRWQAHITSAGVMLEDTKEGYTDWPIMYDDGTMAYDRPERIPAYAKALARQACEEYTNPAALALRLALALADHHLGTDTTRPFAATYGRDSALLARTIGYLQHKAPELAKTLMRTVPASTTNYPAGEAWR